MSTRVCEGCGEEYAGMCCLVCLAEEEAMLAHYDTEDPGYLD